MPDLASLSLQVQQLERDYAWWSTITLWLAGGTAVVAVLYFLSSYVTYYKNDQLREAQRVLTHATEEQLAAVQASATENEQKALELKKLAESEQLARLRLEAQIAPRRLTETQKTQLVQLLQDAPEAVTIISKFLDPEASDFAGDFESALQAAQWKTQRIKNYTATKYGIFIGMVSGTNLESATRLSDALKAISVPHENILLSAEDQTLSPGFQPDTLYLIISAKP